MVSPSAGEGHGAGRQYAPIRTSAPGTTPLPANGTWRATSSFRLFLGGRPSGSTRTFNPRESTVSMARTRLSPTSAGASMVATVGVTDAVLGAGLGVGAGIGPVHAVARTAAAAIMEIH